MNSLFDTSLSESGCSHPFQAVSTKMLSTGAHKSFNSEDFSYHPFFNNKVEYLDIDSKQGGKIINASLMRRGLSISSIDLLKQEMCEQVQSEIKAKHVGPIGVKVVRGSQRQNLEGQFDNYFKKTPKREV